MLTEQEFFDDEAWDDWEVSDDELERLYEQEREKVWATFNSIYAQKLQGVSESTKSYLFEDFKRQYFANQAKADRQSGNGPPERKRVSCQIGRQLFV